MLNQSLSPSKSTMQGGHVQRRPTILTLQQQTVQSTSHAMAPARHLHHHFWVTLVLRDTQVKSLSMQQSSPGWKTWRDKRWSLYLTTHLGNYCYPPEKHTCVDSRMTVRILQSRDGCQETGIKSKHQEFQKSCVQLKITFKSMQISSKLQCKSDLQLTLWQCLHEESSTLHLQDYTHKVYTILTSQNI